MHIKNYLPVLLLARLNRTNQVICEEVPSVPGRAHVQQQEARGGPDPINTAQQLEGVQGTKPQAQGNHTRRAEWLIPMHLLHPQNKEVLSKEKESDRHQL